MATLNAATLQDIQYSGECPAAHAHGKYTLAAAQIADVVRLIKVYAGTKIHGARMINAALGASTTVSIGYEYVNGESAAVPAGILAATSTSSAASTPMAVAPVTLAYDAYITATIGGGAATGQLDVVLNYEFKGV